MSTLATFRCHDCEWWVEADRITAIAFGLDHQKKSGHRVGEGPLTTASSADQP